jgi:dienelactone hydrolase
VRLFEIILLLIATTGLLWTVLRLNKNSLEWFALAVASVIGLALHLSVEGYRWQMLLIYLALLLALVLSRKASFSSTKITANRRSRFISIASLFYLGFATLLPGYILPVFSFEQPSSAYAVGVTSRYWQDNTREERLTANPNDYRAVLAQIWYPAQPNSAEPLAPYHPDAPFFVSELARTFGLPGFSFDSLAHVKTGARLNAAMASSQGTYPVLLFSHGGAGTRVQNTFQMQELASHGYIVVSVEHPYLAVGTVFPDKSTASLTNQSVELWNADWERELATWVADHTFVLDRLQNSNTASDDKLLQGRLDLERVGILGHSFGGSAATESLRSDNRFKAALSMDSPPKIGQPLIRPYMALQTNGNFSGALGLADSDPAYNGQVAEWQNRLNNILQEGTAERYLLRVKGTGHYSFSDFPLISPLLGFTSLVSELDPRRAHRIINDYSLAFFNKYLKGQSSDLLANASNNYPEVVFQKLK